MINRTVRGMEFKDLPFTLECIRSSGRVSATDEELEGFLLSDPKGCFVAEQLRRPVGMSIARSYGKYGFLGATASPEIDGSAIAERDLLDHAAGYLLHCGCEHLFAETRGTCVPLYERAGFVKQCRIVRFAGSVYARSHHHVRALRPHDLSIIGDLDKHSFRADRRFFLKRRYSLTPQFCKVLEMNGRIRAYIMARKAEGVLAVGPWVVTSNADCPADLLESIANEAMSGKLLVEVLETNRAAVDLLRTLGFVESPELTWRMALGKRCNVGLSDSLFAIGSPFTG